MTPRIYFDDPLLLDFEAIVASLGKFSPAGGEAWKSVILTRTAFYPEAGGQMADRGSLEIGGVHYEVVDVQSDDDGLVHHRLANDTAVVEGSPTKGRVDRARRRVHMALHTGQHMLSKALLDEARAPTVSARLGETACTIDVERPSIDEAELARAEDLVNDVIDDDRRIRAFFPTAEELSDLDLRRAPKVDKDVRVVAIDDFDVTPCGGTHCTRTGQVGLVKITGVERYKGKTRVTFTAGRRARVALRDALGTLASLARKLTTTAASAPAAVDKLQAEFAAERERNRALGRDLAIRMAEELIVHAAARGRHEIVATLPGAGTDVLRAVAGKVTKAPGAVAILAGEDDRGRPVVCSRHADATLDCGATLKEIAKRCGGRGGGRPEHAEGRIPLEADIAALFAAITS